MGPGNPGCRLLETGRLEDVAMEEPVVELMILGDSMEHDLRCEQNNTKMENTSATYDDDKS